MARIPKPHVSRPQMETFHKGHATSWLWYALPGPLTMVYSLVVAGSVTGLAYYFGDSMGGGSGSTWMYITIGVMTVIGLLLVGIRAKREKKKAQNAESFEDAVKGSATSGDSGGDPAEIARLDNLRKQFQKGIDAFKDYGKDFYSLPWYVMVGEPGSGKTEAIRHSDLRFPETLQDMLQGTGGTYSMDWWFTNQAVLLDTAGAMLMNPEATKRFEEFLKLLRSYRPDCPVNGIILAIPVDSLLADNPAKLEEKAKRIAQQFTIIQKALDVRFPIYLMVTKSDRLPGFREFTDAPGQQTFDREMLGWSNPADLDSPFDPAIIAGALATIAERLDARRLALLNDPIPRQAGTRRVDEVDSLFGFPETIRSLQPRLQRYLEIIFQTGTWATLPPFFRGVYFTSAMNEGAALDEQLASALGMSIETLPGGGIFNRDKSVYLRDVFTEKIFKERGLVTRLKDIGRALRRKLVWFYATTAILLALVLLFAWMVKRNVAKELEMERENWRVANATWGNGAFLPIVTRKEGADAADGTKTPPRWSAAWQGEGARVWKKLGGESNNLTKIEFLDYLEQRTAHGLPGAGIFRMMGSIRDFERRRRVAGLTVFEGSVLKPVLEGVREKIAWDAMPNAVRDPAQDRRLAAAYDALVRLEAHLHKRGDAWEQADYEKLIEPMLAYLCPPDGKDAGLSAAATANTAVSLGHIAGRLYSGSVFGREGSDGFDTRCWLGTPEDAPADSLGAQALVKGLEAILGTGGVAESATASEDSRKQLKEAKDLALKQYEETEDELAKLDAASASRVKVEELLASLKTHLDDIQLLKGRLGEATRLSGMSRDDLANLCVSLKKSLEPLQGGDMPSNLAAVYGKALEILKTNPPKAAPVNATAASPDKADAVKQIAPEDAAPIRFDIYKARLAQADKIPMASLTLDLIGRLEVEVKGIEQKAEAARTAAKLTYDGPRKEECAKAAAAIDLCMGEIAVSKLLKAYTDKLKQFLDPRLKFPLVISQRHVFTQAEFKPAVDALAKVVKDQTYFDNASATVNSCQGAEVLKKMFAALNDVMTVAKVLNPDNAAQPGGDGLYVQRGFVKPPEKKPDPRAVPVVPIDPLTGQPLIVPPQPVEQVDVGVLTAEVSQSGLTLIGGSQGDKKKIHPNKPLLFTVEVRKPGALQPVTDKRALPLNNSGVWGLVSWLHANPNRNFSVLGVGFGIDSSPTLPAPWPVRSNFGLNE